MTLPKLCEIVGSDQAIKLFGGLVNEVIKDTNPAVVMNLLWQIELGLATLMINEDIRTPFINSWISNFKLCIKGCWRLH